MSFNKYFDLKNLINYNNNSVLGLKSDLRLTKNFILLENLNIDASNNLFTITGSIDAITSQNNNVISNSIMTNEIKFGDSNADDSFGKLEINQNDLKISSGLINTIIKITGSLVTSENLLIEDGFSVNSPITEVEEGEKLFNVDFEGSACGIDILQDNSSGKNYGLFRASSSISNCFSIRINIDSSGNLTVSTNNSSFPSVTNIGNEFYCGPSSASTDARISWNKSEGVRDLNINIKDHPSDYITGEVIMLVLDTSEYAVENIILNLGDSSNNNIFKLGNKIKIVYASVNRDTNIKYNFIPGSFTSSGAASDIFKIDGNTGVMSRRVANGVSSEDIDGSIDELLFCDLTVLSPIQSFETAFENKQYLWELV